MLRLPQPIAQGESWRRMYLLGCPRVKPPSGTFENGPAQQERGGVAEHATV
jgi:hypothetical protein